MPARVALRASANGNGCGVAVVKLADRVLQVSIVPKFWPHHGDAHADLGEELPPNPNRDTPVQKVLVHELQRLVLHGAPDILDLAVSGLTGLQFDSDPRDPGDEEPEQDGPGEQAARPTVGLFTELPARSGLHDLRPAPAPAGGPEPAMRALWDLVVGADAAHLLSAPLGQDLPTYLARTLLPHVQELRPLLLRQFIATTERAVKRRKPRFTPDTDTLGAVRGRIEIADLPRRAARRGLGVRCTYDELHPDTAWQRLVRSAVRVAETELRGEPASAIAWQDRARRIDRQLSDVSLLPPRAALAGIAHQRAPSSERPLRESIALGCAIIRGLTPFGTEEYAGELSPGVAAGVRISTARLFEVLLAQAELGEGRAVGPFLGGLAILAAGGPDKRPDLQVTVRGRRTHLLDAKYKDRSGGPGFSDQYQQYAYACASGHPTGLVYVDPTGASADPVVSRVIVAAPAGDSGWVRPAVGHTGVGFPGPREDLRGWRARTGARLASFLAALDGG